jgi:DNA-binding transcriptional MerR regulator
MRPLPEKKYFKIGEVADLVGVEPHVLRYWETQFPQVRPHKARSGHRLYRRREVETLLMIRELLHVQRFTIAGARQALRQPGAAASLLPRFFTAMQDEAATLPPSPADRPHIDDPIDTEPDEAPEEAELEAVGLSEESLSDALEREVAERAALRVQGREDVAEVEVTVRPKTIVRPMPFAQPPGLGAARRAQLQEALGDARAILALLDREDARAPSLRA